MQQYLNVISAFSKLCEIRPKNIDSAAACSTHSTSVCSIHHNVKLMLTGIKPTERTAGPSTEITFYKNYLPCIICNSSLPEYHSGYCEYCPGEQNLK
jgi:hypothetical protein